MGESYSTSYSTVESTCSPGPPHLQQAQGTVVAGATWQQQHPLLGPGYLAPGPPEGCAGELSQGGRVLSGGALVGGPGQGLQQVVEQAGAQGFVHPLTGQQHVVDLMHALDVARAVLLLCVEA